MQRTYIFTLAGNCCPTLLPRIALTLSRRRVVPTRLQLLTLSPEPGASAECHIELVLTCEPRGAERLYARLAQIVDLHDIDLRCEGLPPSVLLPSSCADNLPQPAIAAAS